MLLHERFSCRDSSASIGDLRAVILSFFSVGMAETEQTHVVPICSLLKATGYLAGHNLVNSVCTAKLDT